MERTQISLDYLQAVKAIKAAILQSQYRAAKSVNREQLALYFSIGKFVSENSREGKWGTNAIESISELLQKELPGLRGFSGTSIKKTRQLIQSDTTGNTLTTGLCKTHLNKR